MATYCNGTFDNDTDTWGNEKTFTCGLYDFLIETVLMGSLCAFGFVGNLLSAVCLWKDKSKSATPFLLVSLELADTLFLVTVLLLRVITSVDTFADNLPSTSVFTFYVGKYVYPVAMMASTGTNYLTVLVTVNRYISVCKPYDASSLCSIPNARKQVIVVWIFAVLFNIPRCLEYDIVEVCSRPLVVPLSSSEDFEGVLQLKLVQTWLTSNRVYQLVYVNVLYFLIIYLVPLLSLVVLNYNLILALRETRRKRENMRSRRFVEPTPTEYGRGGSTISTSRSEDDITLMLIVVVVIFVVSQSPALVTQILLTQVLHADEVPCPNYFFFYERISDLFVVANSSVNFIAYCFCSRRFRKILLSLLRGRTPDSAEQETNAGQQTVDRGSAPFRSCATEHEVGSARKSLLHRMTERHSVKTKSFALSDIKEIQERKPIV